MEKKIGGNAPDASILGKAIDKIRKMGGTLDELVHDTAYQCLVHASAHGDPVLLTRLFYALAKSADRKKFTAWVKGHSPISLVRVEVDGVKTEAYRIKKGWKEDDFLLDEAKETPFWDFATKAGAPREFTLETLCKRLATLAATAEVELADDDEAHAIYEAIVGVMPNAMKGSLEEARKKAADKKKERDEAEAKAA